MCLINFFMKKIKDKKTLGDGIYLKNNKWSFSGEVSKNFDKHIIRSVPLYLEGHKMIEDLSRYTYQKKSLL